MATPRLSKQERDWRAQDDARTLITAEAIKTDTTRRKAAISAAKQIIKEKEKEVKAVRKIIKPTTKRRK